MLVYGSEIWGDALEIKAKRKILAALQRTVALRVASAHRTVSGAAVLVIGGEIPIYVLALEQRRSWKTKREILAINGTDLISQPIRRWQNRRSEETRGRWTARFIQSIKAWMQKNVEETCYFLTHFLSDHSYFRHGNGCIYREETSEVAIV